MFRTELTIAPQERLLPRTARVLTVGSCFADSIGERLRLNKVNTLVNPFGTVFQPLALAQMLRAAAGEAQDWQQHVVEARGRWQSYDFHSTIGAESPVELLQTIQEKVGRVGDFVRTADAVVLTLGTAWAYRLRDTGELVSNLHKLPASLFEKELLTADEIVNALAEVHALLRRINPDIRIVLTVSPVRHIKDTLPLNAVSKSVLRVACHYLSELLPNVSYFPAYELLTDDLRDYRYYAADMLHPSEVAEDYIWERFARSYFDADFGRFRKEWAAVRQSLSHRPLHIGAPEHRTFLDQTQERLERLVSQGVDVRQELRDVQRQLAALPPPRPMRVVEPEPEDDGEERIDIGDGTPTIASAPEIAAGPSRQDNRRDGRDNRRNDRSNRDRRDNRPASASTPAVEEFALPTEEVAEAIATSVEALLTSPEAELLLPATEEAGAYPAKKKKRRSRGGAKRTARKNAARLVGEQDDEAILKGEEEDDAVETTNELAEMPATDAVFAEPFSLAELATEAPVTPMGDADFELADSDEPTAGATELLSEPEQPTATRRRGTGPTPKKSKVITKSGLVKRGQRGGLYRTAAPAPEEAGTPTLGTAPIISAPIIPEILLERPANNLASIPEPAGEPDLAATVLGLYASKPKAAVAATQPKRGRPKATATPATATTEPAAPPVPATNPDAAPNATAKATPTVATALVAETAPATTEASSAAVEAIPAATEATPAVPAKASTRAKKPATKAAKPVAKKTATAKPAAPKKAAAKTAAPRRGRPPGKKAASDTPDAPAA